nr:bacteriocin [uncultured Acidovorax sp.]
MNPSTIEAVNRDNDLAEQARRDQSALNTSVPTPNLRDGAEPSPQAEVLEGSGAAAVGGGAAVGAAAGAAVGSTVGGPVGAVVGGVVGGVAGALGGVAAGPAKIDDPADSVPGPQEREVTRVGETQQENLRR